MFGLGQQRGLWEEGLASPTHPLAQQGLVHRLPDTVPEQMCMAIGLKVDSRWSHRLIPSGIWAGRRTDPGASVDPCLQQKQEDTVSG